MLHYSWTKKLENTISRGKPLIRAWYDVVPLINFSFIVVLQLQKRLSYGKEFDILVVRVIYKLAIALLQYCSFQNFLSQVLDRKLTDSVAIPSTSTIS